jgi:hypothetical protein
MNTSELMRAQRYRVCRQTCEELKAKLKEYDPKKDADIIASTKRTLYTFKKTAAFIEAEIELETEELFQ